MSKGSETRQRIIVKAAALFNRKGFDGCSMQDIVEEVGLEKGSLYGHFPTKEALAVAAFEYAWDETCAARVDGMDAVSNAIEKLKIHAANAVSRPCFPGGCPLMNTITDNDDGNVALKRIARGALKGWRSYLESVVKDGQERKEIRPEVSPEEVAALMISLLEGAMALDRLDKKPGFLEKAGRHVNIYLDTIAQSPN
ncbi:TetR/AcrR family transcriptional repressor of nem operon [Silvibacterium bohemicum]|uniref:TetR/AcrR family transcriptional repressor of nem operon n=1 Tax=Silvibacterium bohemicum TaxID=1577686 RepID=A0A841JZ61_9BACT|nr:TetR/AcrR family transcriptional regulator [Silvibacterium bohemicum]MBB6146430.1 TetR/AcrR family transcriptional repressor of nem operon [Silvibacterium bohemicum]